jgi:N-acetylmuramoyl-L-alanine amidase
MKNGVTAFHQAVSRRTVFKIAGAGALAIALLPRIAFAGKSVLTGLRAAVQPNGKTRLVIETTGRPSHKIAYLAEPNRLVIDISNTGGTVPAVLDGDCLIKSVSVTQNGATLRVTAALKKAVAPIPKDNIMILTPNGDTDYRLVLDFAAGSAGAAIASAAAPASSGQNKRKPVIVIDAGHGGKDPGCIGPNGIREKTIVLTIAKKLAEKLKAGGYSVHLTRSTDVFLNLGTRADIAEKKKSDLFISLHVNANPSRAVKGFSIYTLSKKASDEEAQKLADAENASDKIDVDGFEKFEPDIRNALSALQQHAVAASSVEFANEALKAVKRAGVVIQNGVGMRSAPFAVLRSTIPSALAELGHLSNRDEEKLLNSAGHQNKLVAALVNAVNSYDFDL